MSVKLILGIVLFVIGIFTALIGITGVGDPADPLQPAAAEQLAPLQQFLRNIAVPVIAGLALALGGLLIGLSMGNWSQPRTHLEPGDEIVDPEDYTKMKHV